MKFKNTRKQKAKGKKKGNPNPKLLKTVVAKARKTVPMNGNLPTMVPEQLLNQTKK